jgi:hypothetical protein
MNSHHQQFGEKAGRPVLVMACANDEYLRWVIQGDPKPAITECTIYDQQS